MGAVFHGDLKVWFVPEGKNVEDFQRWNQSLELNTGNADDALFKFKDLMDDLGLEVPATIVDDGLWHYVRVVSMKKKNLSGAYRFSLTGDTDGKAIGAVLNRYSGEYKSFHHKSIALSPEQVAKISAENHLREALHETEKHESQDRAAQHAQEILGMAESGKDHGYLKKKGISPDSALQTSGSELLKFQEFYSESGKTVIKSLEKYLVIPMYNEDKVLRCVQAIDSTGYTKAFMRGGQKGGCMHILGAKSLDELLQSGTAVAYVEGFATGESFYKATGMPVVVCFDAGNLEKVVLNIGAKFEPEIPQFLAIDNDQFYPERALAFLTSKLGLEIGNNDENSIRVRAGKGMMRSVSMGDIKTDGEWHDTANGQYRVVLEKSFSLETIRQISVEVQLPQGKLKGKFLNKGLESGLTASEFLKESGRSPRILTPEFRNLEQNPTDWNDLHKREGARSLVNLLKQKYEINVEAKEMPGNADLFEKKKTISR